MNVNPKLYNYSYFFNYLLSKANRLLDADILKTVFLNISGVIRYLIVAVFITATSFSYALEFDSRLTLRYQQEGDRDLGVENLGAEGVLSGLFQPRLRGSLNDNWYAYSYAEIFAADDIVALDDDVDRLASKGYVGLRELWFDYSGFGRYPGETIRFGLERLREDSALWWDTELLLARWIFDTTLLKATAGIGKKINPVNSDDLELPEHLADRKRIFGSLNYQWRYRQWLGVKVLHSTDRTNSRNLSPTNTDLLYGLNRELVQLGLSLSNGYYDGSSYSGNDETPWLYVVELQAQAGSAVYRVDEFELTEERDVSAWAGEFGLRYRFPTQLRLNIGYHFALGTGSDDINKSSNFQQSGLHSNRSSFTGLTMRESRFGEALRPELNNLRVHTFYVSQAVGELFSWSVAGHHFSRVDGLRQVRLSGLSVPPIDGEKYLGSEIDLVLTYFSQATVSSIFSGSYIRLRGGYFEAGEAFSRYPKSQKSKVYIEFQKRF